MLAFFLAGAWLTSLSIGLIAVFGLEGAGLSSSTKVSVSAGVYLGLGIVAVVVGAHFLRTQPKQKEKKKDSGPSMTQRVMSKDSTWLVFVLGIFLNMPGVWYLIALKDIGLSDYSDAEKVLLLIAFNFVMFSFVEFPLFGFLVAPEWTKAQVDRFNAWLRRNGRHLGGWIGVALGAYLITRGIIAAL